MSSNARAQVARLLTLVPYLHARDEVRVAEAARHFGVTEAQMNDDGLAALAATRSGRAFTLLAQVTGMFG